MGKHAAKWQLDGKTLRKLWRLDETFAALPAGAPERKLLAIEAAQRLGPLAPWWLHPETLELVKKHCKDLLPQHWICPGDPLKPGTALVLVVPLKQKVSPHQSSFLSQRLLLPAPVLPLRWVAGDQHSPQLPAQMVQMADNVASVLKENRFSLRWLFENQVDAQALPCSAKSAFIPLALGLRLAQYAQYAAPKPTIWATGAWDKENVEVDEVDGISRKLATCILLKGTHFFVPKGDHSQAVAEAQRYSWSGLKICSLPMEQDLNKVLEGPLDQLPVPPPPGAEKEKVVDFYRYLVRVGSKLKDEFYLDRILESTVEHCRNQLNDSLRKIACQRPVLVSILSNNYGLIYLAYRVFNASRAVILMTSKEDRPYQAAQTRLQQWQSQGMQFRWYEFPGLMRNTTEDELERAFQKVERIYRELQQSGQPVLVDHTPGFRTFSLALMIKAPEDVHHVYLTHRTVENSLVADPGTERYIDLNRFKGRT